MKRTKQFCLIISLLGILILLLIVNFSEIKISEISSVKLSRENQQVKISGIVISKQIYKENNFTSFKLKDSTGEINIICNCPNIKINQTLEVIGKVQQYQKQMQISADKINLLE
jgi:RecJ-like exonuclease